MENSQSLKALYEAAQPKNTYYLAPRVGFYKIESTYGMVIGRQVELIATAIWKPAGATKSTPGLIVDVQLSLLEKYKDDKIREHFDSSAIKGHVIEVISSEVITKDEKGKPYWVYQGNYKMRGKPVLRRASIDELMKSDTCGVIIDQFLSDTNNLSLFSNDALEYFEEPLDIDYDVHD
jgi:hypothetical protein